MRLQSRVVEALLAFAAALVSLRLSGDLLRRYRERRAPELAAWAAALAAYALAAAALAWGAAAGWSDAVFRVYYLGGALLTAALLGFDERIGPGPGQESHRERAASASRAELGARHGLVRYPALVERLQEP